MNDRANDRANDEERRKRNECDPVGIEWDGVIVGVAEGEEKAVGDGQRLMLVVF